MPTIFQKAFGHSLMRFISHIFLFSFISLYSIATYATVGGGQNIEVLGYEAREQKVYILRTYEDARGRTPQLYYYNLKSQYPEKLIAVKSIYIDPKTNQVDYDTRWDEVMHSIETIQKRLTPLIPIQNSTISLKTRYSTQYVTAWHDPEQQAPQYNYTYTVLYNTYKSTLQRAISYKPQLFIQQAFKIPKHHKMIVTVRYLAFPEETGYYTEDPVMLSTTRP